MPLKSQTKEVIEEYSKLGLEKILKGEVGILLLSGGQGSRLGFDHPKGMFNIGMPSNKSLFQYFVDRIIGLKKLANNYAKAEEKEETSKIFLYIMTSQDNGKE